MGGKNRSKHELMKELDLLRSRVHELEARIGADAQIDEFLENPAAVTRLMTENANDAIYVVQDGSLKFVNEKTAEIIGSTTDELKVRPFIEFVHPDDRAVIRERHQRRLRGEAISNMYPFRIIDRQGDTKWIEVNNVLIAWQGKPATICFMRDITEKKKAEDAIMQSERLLADIINFLPDATFAIDQEGKVIAWNRAIEALTGIASGSMIGKGDYAYALALYDEKIPMLIDKVMHPSVTIAEKYLAYRSEEHFLLAETEIVRNGRSIFFWCKASLIYDHKEKMIGAIESLRDITVLKKTESEIKAKTRSLKEMNTALKVLLKQREGDNREIEERFLLNVKKLVLPYVLRLKACKLDPNLSFYVDIIENHLQEIISPFLAKLTSKYDQLTPREIQVASLIKDGMTTKEMAVTLNISANSVDIYRQNIRKKMGLIHKKTNLKTFFSSLHGN